MENAGGITGYRALNDAEKNKINEAKALETQVARFIAGLETAAAIPGGVDPLKAELNEAKKRFTEGFMWLTRSIAKPE